VILSACNTADGEAPGAEALSGLARSFFHAGAKALLVSHWRVDSDSTAQIVASIFERAPGGATLNRAKALRQAMIGYQKTKTDPWAAYPGFWAAFSLIGDGGQQ
jgi:CHAT domain-containing protein